MPLVTTAAAPEDKTLLVPASTAARLPHIVELDGIRGIAAMAVFFHHVCFTTIPVTGWGPGIRALSAVSAYGGAGVDLFFVLSGFLITSLLLGDRLQPAYYRNFYWKRALRILPLYAVCLVAVFVLMPGSRTYVIVSALFIANFAVPFHIENAGPFWTLAIEEQFYLLWPTVVRRRSVAAVSRWALVLGLSAVALRLAAAWTGHHNYQFTFFRCDGLAVGAWLACRFLGRERLVFRGRSRTIVLLTLVLSLGLAIVSLDLPATTRGIAYSSALMQTAMTACAGAFIALLLAHHGAAALRLLRAPVLRFFGLISYAFYLIHLYALYAYDRLRGPLPAGDLGAYWLRFGVVLGATVALALLSRYAIELPAMRLRRNKTSTHQRE